MYRKILLGLVILWLIGLIPYRTFQTGMAQPVRGGTLVVGMLVEPRVLDGTSGAWNAQTVAGNIFSTLIQADDKLKIIPGLAESWNMDYKNRTYTFNIRKGVRWHDGKPFTVQDVKFSLETLLANNHINMEYLKGTQVDIVSDTKVVVKPGIWSPGVQVPMFASEWAMYPKHLLEGVDFPKSDFRKNPVGTGPFKFKEWVRGSYITLERNNDFWRPNKPYLDKVIFKTIQDPSLLLLSLTTGEVDFVYRGLPYEACETMKKNPNLQVLLDHKPNLTIFLLSNTKHPILSNVMVRKAIMHALNRKDIAAKATSNVSQVTDRFFSSEFVPNNPNITVYDYNPKKAEELLDRAGYPRKNGGTRFSIQLLVRAGETDEEKTADLVKEYLKKVGIDITIKKADYSTCFQLHCTYQYDMSTYKRWIHPVHSRQVHHSEWIRRGIPFSNVTQYSNSKVDQSYDQWAYNAASEDVQIKGLLNAESILTDELPEMPLFDVTWMYVWSKRVKNAFVTARYVMQEESFENVYISE